MKSINDVPNKKQEDKDLDNPAKSFKNSRNEYAAEINRGDAKSKTYKGEGDNEEGPNWDKVSKDADGDTGQNAGIFK